MAGPNASGGAHRRFGFLRTSGIAQGGGIFVECVRQGDRVAFLDAELADGRNAASVIDRGLGIVAAVVAQSGQLEETLGGEAALWTR